MPCCNAIPETANTADELNDADRLLLSAIRLLATPCARARQMPFKKASPAEKLDDFLAAVNRHARRVMLLAPISDMSTTQDELALLSLVAAQQNDMPYLAQLKASWLVSSQGRTAVLEIAADLANGLLCQGHNLSLPAHVTPRRQPAPSPAMVNESNIITPVFSHL
jgi:antitoxin component of RelBE/YafQ-DinJ toxin-antitoxin module